MTRAVSGNSFFFMMKNMKTTIMAYDKMVSAMLFSPSFLSVQVKSQPRRVATAQPGKRPNANADDRRCAPSQRQKNRSPRKIDRSSACTALHGGANPG